MGIFDSDIFDDKIFDVNPKPSTFTPETPGTYIRKKGQAAPRPRLKLPLLSLLMDLLKTKMAPETLLATYSQQELMQLWTLVKGNKLLPQDNLEMVDWLGLASGEFMTDSIEES